MSDEENLNLEELQEQSPPPENEATPDPDTPSPPETELPADEIDPGTIISGLEAVYDIPVRLSAVLGRSTMQVSQLLKLGRGAVIELDRKVGEAIDIYVNDRLVARGEVVVLDERLGITMTEIIKSDRH
ncbi:MAG: flagellar motor switch protein FliN [Rhodospirillaceae bacterium]|nr:MAG: flagellar motor switch protein FliN [Rhodospirillaceae bacterium]